jgi:hypothetical protein
MPKLSRELRLRLNRQTFNELRIFDKLIKANQVNNAVVKEQRTKPRRCSFTTSRDNFDKIGIALPILTR